MDGRADSYPPAAPPSTKPSKTPKNRCALVKPPPLRHVSLISPHLRRYAPSALFFSPSFLFSATVLLKGCVKIHLLVMLLAIIHIFVLTSCSMLCIRAIVTEWYCLVGIWRKPSLRLCAVLSFILSFTNGKVEGILILFLDYSFAPWWKPSHLQHDVIRQFFESLQLCWFGKSKRPDGQYGCGETHGKEEPEPCISVAHMPSLCLVTNFRFVGTCQRCLDKRHTGVRCKSGYNWSFQSAGNNST